MKLSCSNSSTASTRASSRAGSDAGSTKGYVIERRDSTRRRVHCVAAQVLKKITPMAASAVPVLKVSVTTAFEAKVTVSLDGAKQDGKGLPAVCRAGTVAEAAFSAPRSQSKSGLKGAVKIGGFDESTELFIGPGGSTDSWVVSKGHWKHTSTQAAAWNWKEAAEKPTEGQAADIELSGGEMKIHLRAQTAVELKRCLALQALRGAMEFEDYDSLRAQVTKARMASCDQEHIALGEARLKVLKEKGLHVNEGCDKASIRQKLNWDLVTSCVGAEEVNDTCKACEDCPCNVSLNPGEVMDIQDEHVQEILKASGPHADKVLFEQLVGAALAAEEGCVWRAGGKLIFSEFNRNQSVAALERRLEKTHPQCCKMLMELHSYTERKYNGFVTAIQVNMHTDGTSHHDQHRDIYSVKQSAGPNCTCQFQDCVGTVCYSIGSSRQVLLETMTDKLSNIQPCGENCQGRRERRWLHSGASMYFNGPWNDNHTHGIPATEGCGPRISLAFLLASKPTTCMFVFK